ncbi:heavy metal translocating P-type ATPase [cf. Phormidesmis sp. LEGE 11477]|uniref:heavy metal translocating P-type ATPase n=1 Tax=cf. Phormidesmis sp. LEGE 11477 TaxID=1828680 RepID=UPI00187E639E|nr:heavy metal translocating P-type ATPase [cf. Phormidesmis sp. LEGE 11477]MBE9060633.1 cadmium-translocating P-type ATPase [cf. Phormidesmis sp. LEGE 11477]
MTKSVSSSSCCDHSHGHRHSLDRVDWRAELTPAAIAIVLFIFGIAFKQSLHNTPYAIAEYAVFLPAYLLSGWSVLTTAGRNILRGRVFDENFLMTIATLGAIAIHELPEAVGVMLFFQVGELFQGYAVGRSRQSIKALLEVQPNTANLKVDGELRAVSPESVEIGDVVVVRPGEKVPLDGEILSGKSQVDTSALTGESVPRSVSVGETVLAGMINQSGLLALRVTKPFHESSIARILELVENASSKKAQTERFITRFARYYTPIVVVLSLAVAILPPLLVPGATQAEWIYRALVLLVISCPCGLVISIPLGYFGGIGGAAKRGILIKGSTFVDALAQVKTVVFDKTGTLTKGNFLVSEVVTQNGLSEHQLLKLAAQVEAQSNHPVAQSIRAAYGQSVGQKGGQKGDQNRLQPSRAKDFGIQAYEEIAGQGIRARLGSQTVLAGNDRLLHRENIPHDVCHVDGTVAHLAIDGSYAGRIVIADELKEESAAAISALKKQNIWTVMLTGDSQFAADTVAQQLGLDDYRAELLPEDKVDVLETFLSSATQTRKNSHAQKNTHKKVAFVGDGINDAPAIARADVGIAMGGLGSDAAIETADVVVMTDSPAKVAEAIALSHRTLRIIWQNIIIAMTIKAVFIALGAIGIASLWAAVFADVGVALLAILNASRVLRA